MRSPRIALSSAVAASLTLLGMGLATTPATAAGCYGYSCHGYDMNHFGCTYTSTTSAAAVDYRTGVIVAYVYNRYSAGCNSNWTEAQLTPAGYAAGDTLVGEIFTTDSQGKGETMYYPGNGNQGALNEPSTGTYYGTSSIYTDMVDGTNLTTSDALVYSGTLLISAGSGEARQ